MSEEHKQLEQINSNMVINYESGKGYYCRSSSYQCERLVSLLTTIYSCRYTVLVPTGSAAITTSLESCATKLLQQYPENQLNIIYSDELYSETPSMCKNFAARHGAKTHIIDVINNDQIINKFKELSNHSNIFFIESCTNPTGKIIDYSIIKIIKEISPNTIVIVDNTWLSHIIFNPFTIPEIDLVVLSLTKLYSGGQAIGGAILSNFDEKITFKEMIVWTKYCGFHMSPFNAKTIVENISNASSLDNTIMQQRLLNSHKNTCIALEHLKTIPEFTDIKHYSLDNHCSCETAKKYFKNIYSPILVFHVNVSYNKVKSALEALKIIKPVTSYGHPYTSICNYIKCVKIQGKKVVRIRLALGYVDEPEKIINGINELRELLK